MSAETESSWVLKCPNCGCQPVWQYTNLTFQLKCEECGLAAPKKRSKIAATISWHHIATHWLGNGADALAAVVTATDAVKASADDVAKHAAAVEVERAMFRAMLIGCSGIIKLLYRRCPDEQIAEINILLDGVEECLKKLT